MLKVVAVALAVIAVGLGSFFAVRALRPAGEPEAQAQAPPQGPTVEEMQQAFEADRLKPRLTGQGQVINGIRAGSEVKEPFLCQGKAEPNRTVYVDAAKARGTAVYVEPGYLPKGAVLRYEEAIACTPTDTPFVYSRHYVVESDTASGTVVIARAVQPVEPKVYRLYGAADRIGPITIAGKPGVIERPILPNGFLGTFIVLDEGSGLLVVQTGLLSPDEAIRIAENIK